MKKGLLLLLVASLLVLMLAGCGMDISAVIGGFKSEFMGYQKNASIIIVTAREETSYTSSDFAEVARLLPTYIAFIESDAVREEVRKLFPDTEFTVSAKQASEQSGICVITVTSKTEENLAAICNATAQCACDGLNKMYEDIKCSVLDRAR